MIDNDKDLIYKKVKVSDVDIGLHYQRCKNVILSYCKENGAFRALIGNHNHWWNINKEKGTAKLFYPDDQDYDLLTSKYRTLYWTAQLFSPDTANIEKEYDFEKHQISEQIGGSEDTVYHSFFLDLDKAKEKDIHNPEVVKWLERAIKFFADTLRNAGVESFGIAFSGGGVYCVLHPQLGLIGKETNESDAEYSYRVSVWQRAFDFFIGDTASKFFEENPEALEYVKFDKLNYDKKRQVKTILSIHKKYPYAVIPLDNHNPKIDLEEAALPVSDAIIEKAKNWLIYQNDIENFGNFLKPWTDKAKETIKKTHGTRTVTLESEEVSVEQWAPCIRNIVTKKHLKSGEGATRALSVLASYMRYVCVPEEKAYNIFKEKADEWNAETSNIFESWYGCEHLDKPTCFVPSCDKIRTKGSGYPHPELGELELCTPDERCKEIRSPIYYHKTPEKRLSGLMEAIEKEVSAEINDGYKAVLVDTTVEKYLDKQTGKEKIQIKDPERKEKYVLYCVLKSIPQDQVSDNTVFELWSELEPWKKESKRGQLATRFYDYNIITDEKKSEALKKTKVKVDELYRELIPKRKAQQEALSKYFKLIKEIEENKREYNEEERKKALELLKDPLLMPKIKLVLDFKFAGFEKKKLEVFCNLLSKDLDPKRRVSPNIYGKWGEGKSVLTEKVLSFFPFERMNSATPPSVYRKAQIDENYFDRKIIYFGDVGEDANEELKEVLDVFKQLISEGEVVRGINLKIGEDYMPVSLKLCGYPILIWTAQTPPSDPQQLSRIMPYNIDVSKEQRERVRLFSGYEEDTPEELRYPSEIKELERTIKVALEILKENKKRILNPFAFLINLCMDIDSPNVNRDRFKFFSLVASITHLYQFQRDIIQLKGKEYLIVRPIDVLYALYLAKEDFEVLFGDLDAIAQRAYNLIKEKRNPISSSLSILKLRTKDTDDKDDRAAALHELEAKAFTNSDLEDWLNVSYKTVTRITRNLYKKGFLSRDRAGKEYKFYLVSEDSKTKTDGVVLFDSRRMLEGLMDETTVAEWLDRTFSPDPESIDIKNYFLTEEDLAHISVPDAKIKIKNTHVFWGKGENEESEQPQTFKYLTKNGNILRDTRRAKEESLGKEERKESGEQKPIKIKKIILEVGKCKECGKEEIDLIYVVHYSNDEFKNVCDECGKRIMKDFGLKLIGGDKQ